MRVRVPRILLAVVAALSLGVGSISALTAQSEPDSQPPKRILILYDENKDDLPGLDRIDRSLRESFRERLGRVEIYSESMGISRAGRPGYESQLADFYRSKYAGRMPDLIVAVMEPALNFLLRQGDRIFPGIPIVFAGIDASSIQGKKLPDNVTGVLLKRRYSPTLAVALHLQPDTRHVFVVAGGDSPFDQFLQALVRRDLRPWESRADITYLFGLNMDTLLTRLSSLPRHGIILYVSVLTDGSGRRFVPAEVLSSITASANAPVYVFLEQYVGLGAVGGNVYSFQTHGAQVAALGLEILRGASPASLPLRELEAQVNLFDANQLRRWNLSQARLPSGSIIRNQEFSLWALYRWQIIGAIALLLLQGGLIGGLLLARRQQRRAEAEARQRRDELAHVLRVTTLSEMTSSLVHEISHPVGAMLLNARAATRLMESGRPENASDLAAALADITANARHTSLVIDRLRALFRGQRTDPRPVDVKALIEDAVRVLHSAMLIGGIDIRLVLGEACSPVFGDPVQLEQVLLNVLVNARDALREASNGPRVITIWTRQDTPRSVIIEVADTGPGVTGDNLERLFEHFYSTKPKGLGLGLAISRSIIEVHGGRIWATANPDRGLTIHIELPCSKDNRSSAGSAVEGANNWLDSRPGDRRAGGQAERRTGGRRYLEPFGTTRYGK